MITIQLTEAEAQTVLEAVQNYGGDLIEMDVPVPPSSFGRCNDVRDRINAVLDAQQELDSTLEDERFDPGELEAEQAWLKHAERENPEEYYPGGIYDPTACHCVREHSCGWY